MLVLFFIHTFVGMNPPTDALAALDNSITSAPEPSRVSFQEVAGGLSNPLAITHAGDASGRLFVVERSGRIRVIKNGALLSTPFLDIQSIVKSTSSEQGLLGLAFHPAYESNGRFYVLYTATRPGDSNGSILTLKQYSVSTGNPDLANSASGVTILTIDHPAYTNHNGGTLAFGNDGYLYWSTGDGGSGGDPDNNGQNLTSLLGKVLRLDVDSGSPYAVPASNPFFGDPNPNTKLIWAYGLRNPWRMSFDRLTHDLYIGDVGQGAREEIDFQPATSGGGENYGWRVMEGSLCYNPSSGCNQTGKVLPVAEYDHSLGCSVTGGYVYRGSNYPSLYGYYVYGDFCSGRIFAIYKNLPSGWIAPFELADTPYNISTFGEDEQGELYLADYASGKIFKIQYQEPAYSISGNAGASGVVLSYVDGTSKTVTSQTDGSYTLQVTPGWSGTVTPTHACYTFTPASRTYTNVVVDQTGQDYTASFNPASGCSVIDVAVSGNLTGTYALPVGQSDVDSYLGVNGGPVVVKSTNGANIIASYLQYRRPGTTGGWTGITQTMGLTDAQIADRYVFPHYDYTDSTRYNSLQLANFDTVDTTIKVEIGGVLRGTFAIGVGSSQNVTFPGVKGGPVVVYSDNGAKIVVSLYELKRPETTGYWTGQTTMMGLPWTQRSDTYVIPRYNYTLQDLLPYVVFANADSLSTTVTVTIGGVVRGTYALAAGQSRVEAYSGVNGGPVVVTSNNGAKIIASYLQYRRPGTTGGWTGITQTMGLTDAQIADRYVFPHYDYTDSTRYNSLQLANFDVVSTNVTVEIGGVPQGTFALGVGSSQNVTFPSVIGGPVVVYSDNGAKIVTSLYELKRTGSSGYWTGQTTMMGLPWTQLSDTYVIPRYNYTLQDLLPFVVFAVP